MLVKVSFAKINGEKVLVQWNFVIFSVSNCFTLFKIFGDTHSYVGKTYFSSLFFLIKVIYSIFDKEMFWF